MILFSSTVFLIVKSWVETSCFSIQPTYIISFVRSKNIGLGNGQRKSGEFEEYVLEKRKYLRNELKLCERATQRVLLYSNNFLHKRLKTDPAVSGLILRLITVRKASFKGSTRQS